MPVSPREIRNAQTDRRGQIITLVINGEEKRFNLDSLVDLFGELVPKHDWYSRLTYLYEGGLVVSHGRGFLMVSNRGEAPQTFRHVLADEPYSYFEPTLKPDQSIIFLDPIHPLNSRPAW
jgi:hypothetical protein